MTFSSTDPTPAEAVQRLAQSRQPLLIGVRHHSPVLAAAIPELLQAFAPQTVLVELPEELAEWLPWLGHPDTVAPVALAAARDGEPTGFYPFADFSPELAAVRWAMANGVPASTCDLPLALRSPMPENAISAPHAEPGLRRSIRGRLTGRDDDDMWDRWVEASAPGSTPEACRRAALAAGWAIRRDTTHIDPLDLAREAWMRRCINAAADRVAVIVGAFHAPALLDGPIADSAPPRGAPFATSLVPYTFELLDSRSGYPAGIRDPRWQQGVYDCQAQPSKIEELTTALAVEITARMRDLGHPAGPAEAREAARLACDLARLRGLPAPARGELVEALQSTLAHGEPIGRGRAVAQAMRAILIGGQRGSLAPDAPISGLQPAVTELLNGLRLPGPGSKWQTVRLDPMRSPLDRRREITLQRLAVCAVPYGERETVTGTGTGNVDALTTAWRIEWTPATDAAITVAGMYGVTLSQAVEGRLRSVRAREIADGGPTATQVLTGLTRAAECGLDGLTRDRLTDVAEVVCHAGSLAELVAAVELADRLQRGHIPGLPQPPAAVSDVLEDLYAAAVRSIDGLSGSERIDDARALLGLVQRADAAGRTLRLDHTLQRISRNGSPLMQGATAGVLVLLAPEYTAEFAQRLASWVDAAEADMVARLQGTLAVAGPLLEAGDEALTPLLERIETLADEPFLRRLPGLRAAFDVLTPAARDRLLATVRERTGDGHAGDPLTHSPQQIAQWLEIDLSGRAAVEALHLPIAAGDMPGGERPAETAVTVAKLHRWRLILGRDNALLEASDRKLATALDELYGFGRGEGSYGVGTGAGREAPFPTVRQWSQELEALFGSEVRDEVLARAAAAGRADAALAVDPQTVRPSMELLHTVLSLAGGMPESRLAKLRPLVARLVAALTAQLAQQMRPALTGLTTPRRTRRPTGVLDLAATVRANLRTARTVHNGQMTVVPERPVFRSRGRRSVQWRVIVLTDVSGSMEPSTIWSALTASILAGVPAIETHFVTFSTGVVDLTGRVSDPLALLLEISVGGGTHIAAGLRYARSLVTVPSRTMIVVISDFEEGYPLGGLLGEVRELVGSGCRLLGCASLDDRGQARYSVGVAEQLVAAGMPVAALSPLALARWIAEQVQ